MRWELFLAFVPMVPVEVAVFLIVLFTNQLLEQSMC